jgi:hypothetical protein
LPNTQDDESRHCLPTLDQASAYLHSGQQPVDPIFVAAAAAVPNIATRAAASPTNFIFIVNSHSK